MKTSRVYRNIHPNTQPFPNRANCMKSFEKEGKHFIIVGYDSGDLFVYGFVDKEEWKE